MGILFFVQDAIIEYNNNKKPVPKVNTNHLGAMDSSIKEVETIHALSTMTLVRKNAGV